MPMVAFHHGQKSRCGRGNALHFAPRAPPGRRESVAPDSGDATRSNPMMDILMLALGLGFFAVAIGYTYACERL